jgi:hypothetical protein
MRYGERALARLEVRGDEQLRPAIKEEDDAGNDPEKHRYRAEGRDGALRVTEALSDPAATSGPTC